MTQQHGSVPPLAGGQVSLLLLQLGLLLALALGLGAVARRFGQPVVIAELLAGVLLGPSVLGWALPGVAGWLFPARAGQVHLLDACSQLGAVLLVGMTGAQLDLRMIARRRGAVATVGVGGLVVPLGLGLGAGYLVPSSLFPPAAPRAAFAAFLGVAMCVSAIPVIAKTLADMRLIHRDVGQIILGAATVEDVAAWFLLSVVSAMVTHALGPAVVVVWALRLLGFVAAAAVLGRPLVALALRLAARTADPGPVNAMAAALILLGAAAAQALAMEPVFGALVAGSLIGHQRAVEPARLAPLRVTVLAVLAPIFLAAAGLRADLTLLGTPPVAVAGAVILLLAVVGKFVGAYAGARLSRLTHREGLALGAGLNARGVVEIVIATVGLRLGVLTMATYTIVVLVAILTSVMAPPFLRMAMTRVEQTAEERLRENEHAMWSHSTHTTSDFK